MLLLISLGIGLGVLFLFFYTRRWTSLRRSNETEMSPEEMLTRFKELYEGGYLTREEYLSYSGHWRD